MGKTFRNGDAENTAALQRRQRDERDAQRAAAWARDAKRFDAWSPERRDYEDELNAFIDRNLPVA